MHDKATHTSSGCKGCADSILAQMVRSKGIFEMCAPNLRRLAYEIHLASAQIRQPALDLMTQGNPFGFAKEGAEFDLAVTAAQG